MQSRWLFIFVLLSPIGVFSQHPNKPAQSDLVKKSVGTIAGSKQRKAEIVLNDLREFKGKIIAVYPDYFVLEPKSDKGVMNVTIPIITIGNVSRSNGIYIKYTDVLQLKGKGAVLSFVPDPRQSPFSTWDYIGTVDRGEFLQLHLSDGRKVHGVFFRSTTDSLSLLRGNKSVVVPMSDILKVYKVKGDVRSLASKIADGGLQGVRVSEDWLPIGDPRGYANPTALTFGAAVGATLYILSIGRTERVLLFSK